MDACNICHESLYKGEVASQMDPVYKSPRGLEVSKARFRPQHISRLASQSNMVGLGIVIGAWLAILNFYLINSS
jgi:hypothetical protein